MLESSLQGTNTSLSLNSMLTTISPDQNSLSRSESGIFSTKCTGLTLFLGLASLLGKPALLNNPISMTYLENLLNVTILTTLWQYTFRAKLTFSKCFSHWESFQNIFHWWNYIVYILAFIFPDLSAKYWRYCQGLYPIYGDPALSPSGSGQWSILFTYQ